MAVLRTQAREVILASGALIATNGCFYIMIAFVIAYSTKVMEMTRLSVLFAVLLASAIMIPAIIALSALSDRIGRKAVFVIGAVGTAIWSFPFFALIKTTQILNLDIAFIVALALLAAMYGPQAAYLSELFDTKVRYSGASLGYQLGAVIGGGFAPLIAEALFAKSHATGPIAIYMIVMCLISLASIFALERKRRGSAEGAQL